MKPIKIYAPEKYREPTLFTHIELLFPFWGITAKESMPYVRATALQYQYSKEAFTLVDHIEDCDYVAIPYQYERLKAVNPEKARMIEEEAHSAGKPLLIDGSGDLEYPISIPNCVVLRIGQYQYNKQPYEITVPSLAEDLLESHADGKLQLRQKPERPSVSFTGWAAFNWKTRLKIWAKELPVSLISIIDTKRGAEHKGIVFRNRALKALARCPRVETNFIARPSYSGHVKTVTGSITDNRKAFVDNLLSSDYALCVRGDPNSSLRFYEALALGRIPLFLDTSCVLPFEDQINYRDFCVFVNWRDINRMGDILADFNKNCSPERFIDMQIKARAAYRDYLRTDSFSRHLAEELRKRLQDKLPEAKKNLVSNLPDHTGNN